MYIYVHCNGINWTNVRWYLFCHMANSIMVHDILYTCYLYYMKYFWDNYQSLGVDTFLKCATIKVKC